MTLRLWIRILALFLVVGPAQAIEVDVLKPPPGREYVWCLQSPFDREIKAVVVLDGGSRYARITLVSGEEAFIYRSKSSVGESSVLESSVEGFPDIHSYTAPSKRTGAVVLLVEDIGLLSVGTVVEPDSELAEELRIAYQEWKDRVMPGRPHTDDVFQFILEPLMQD